MAEVALPGVPIPGAGGGLVLRRAFPADELLRDEAAGVLGPHEFVDRIAVQIRGVRTGAAFQVVRKSRRAYERPLAERAF